MCARVGVGVRGRVLAWACACVGVRACACVCVFVTNAIHTQRAYSYWKNNKFTQNINKQTDGKTTFTEVNTHGKIGLKSGSK